MQLDFLAQLPLKADAIAVAYDQHADHELGVDRRAAKVREWFFKKIKRCRRVVGRYDNLAVNYLAFISLASIRIRLHAYESAL
jgi:transposase